MATNRIESDLSPGSAPPFPAPPAAPLSNGFATAQQVQTDKAIKATDGMLALGHGNLEAIAKSGQIWSAGVQDLSRKFAAWTQVQLDHSMATWKTMAATKSPQEAMELQGNLLRTSFERAFSEAGSMTEASMKLATDAMAPIKACMARTAGPMAPPVR